MQKLWGDDAWSDYEDLQFNDRVYLKKLNRVIKDVDRNGTENAEPLSHDKRGMFSRRVDKKNRFVFNLEGGVMNIFSVVGHYDDK